MGEIFVTPSLGLCLPDPGGVVVIADGWLPGPPFPPPFLFMFSWIFLIKTIITFSGTEKVNRAYSALQYLHGFGHLRKWQAVPGALRSRMPAVY